jgi:glycolate oxidase
MGKQYDFDVICYGHAGDGNLHIRIRKEGVPNSFGHEPMQAIIAELFKLVHGLGGTISAEHGIGLIQKSFMPIVFEETSLRLMRDIKRSFDPNGILNADKIF